MSGARLSLKNTPRIIDWIVTYDQDGLPGIISGVVIDNFNDYHTGQSVVVNPFSLDLKSKLLEDASGQVWRLSGKGSQSIITDHVEPFNFIRVIDDEEPG